MPGRTVTVAHDREAVEEKTERQAFTPSEAVQHGERLRERIEADAKARRGTRTDLQPSANLAEGSEPRTGRETDSRLAKASGMASVST